VALTNRQIERYSRQLIVDKFGGLAQERLLESRVLLIAAEADAETVLAYLVGAGVGKISLQSELAPASRSSILARMRDLNSDSTVTLTTGAMSESGGFDLALIIVGDDWSLDRSRDCCDHLAHRATASADNPEQRRAFVLARLDLLAKVAVIPQSPPCPRCASIHDLLAPFGTRADNANFIATLAALEVIKLLARSDPAPRPTLIDFRGYETSAQAIEPLPAMGCACASARAGESPS
jgi:molybdopterin/thiamine biosynthesis adenylyltransferase